MRRTALIIMMLISSPAFASKDCNSLKNMGEAALADYVYQTEQAKQTQSDWEVWRFDVWGKFNNECVEKTGDRNGCSKKANAKHADEEPKRVEPPKISDLDKVATYATIYTAFCKR